MDIPHPSQDSLMIEDYSPSDNYYVCEFCKKCTSDFSNDCCDNTSGKLVPKCSESMIPKVSDSFDMVANPFVLH